jgi:uncharacterized protein (DUF169 family)
MATDYRQLAQQLTTHLGPTRPPVAVAFLPAPPTGVEPFRGTQPSGCSFWRLAAENRVFYTVPTDHANCAIGAHTHAIPLPPGRAAELEQTLTFMTGLGYVRMEEVPGIPRLPATPGAVVYAPLAATPVDPDVVLVAGRPGRLMLAQEAAIRAGVAAPAALAQGVLLSSACVGNRLYTDLGEDELYVTIPGRALAPLVAELATIASANTALRQYHEQRRRELASA